MKRIVAGSDVVDWVAKRTGEFGSYGAAVAIGIERNGELIAGVVFNEFNGANMNMHVAALPRARWIDRTFLAACFGYAFQYVNRVTALVGDGNKASRKLCDGLGFTLECKLEAAHPTGAMCVYRMFKKDCRWIEAKDEQKLVA